MYLYLTASIGLFAALLMFCGDMLLYFTKEQFVPDGTLNPYFAIMKKIPTKRLMLGGLIGTIAAFFYCIGFLNFIPAALESANGFAITAVLFHCLGIIVGGAYHSQFVYFGLIEKSGSDAMKKRTLENVALLLKTSMVCIAIGSIILTALIMLGQTIYPRWMAVLTPTVLIFFSGLWSKLPQPFCIVLFGGWNNLVYVILFLSMLMFTVFGL